MTALTLLLALKIVVTLIMVAMPFLILPKPRLEAAMSLTAHSTALFRLYGVAILALLVGYAGGIWQVSSGVFPWGVVAMGLVSNAGASTALLVTGTASQNRFLTVFFIAVAVCLALAAAFPDTAMRAIF